MATERILNLEELKSSSQWHIDKDGDWLPSTNGAYIKKSMVNKSVQWCKDQAYTVTPDMIAPQQTNENKPNKTTTARNGTKLEVGKKYKLRTYFEGNFVEIIAIGEKEFFFKSQDGDESINPINQDWIPYTEELPAIFTTEDMLNFASWAANQYRHPTDRSINLDKKVLELYLKENHES